MGIRRGVLTPLSGKTFLKKGCVPDCKMVVMLGKGWKVCIPGGGNKTSPGNEMSLDQETVGLF